MADTINKNIQIQVSADTEQLKTDVGNLNQTLDTLLNKQQQLSNAGQQNTKVFQDNAAQIRLTQAAIDNHTDALGDNAKALTDQKNSVTDLTNGFNKLNTTTANFGPALAQAAKGFDVLKSGASGTKTSVLSLDEALKKINANASDGNNKLSKQKQAIAEKYAFEIELAQDNSKKIKSLVSQREQEINQLEKKADQERANFALQISKQVAASAFTIISQSIAQQGAAKIAGLEKENSLLSKNTGKRKMMKKRKPLKRNKRYPLPRR